MAGFTHHVDVVRHGCRHVLRNRYFGIYFGDADCYDLSMLAHDNDCFGFIVRMFSHLVVQSLDFYCSLLIQKAKITSTAGVFVSTAHQLE